MKQRGGKVQRTSSKIKSPNFLYTPYCFQKLYQEVWQKKKNHIHKSEATMQNTDVVNFSLDSIRCNVT